MPDSPAPLDGLGSAKYVSLTTFRKSGEPVATPVWVVRDGDRLAVITEDGSGKVKRLRNDPRVRLAVSDARGRVADGALSAEGTAELVSGAEADHIRGLIGDKYGLVAKVLIPIVYRVRDFVKRRPQPTAAGLVITLEG